MVCGGVWWWWWWWWWGGVRGCSGGRYGVRRGVEGREGGWFHRAEDLWGSRRSLAVSVKAMSELLSRWMLRRGVRIRAHPLPSLVSLRFLIRDQSHPPDPGAPQPREPDLEPVGAGGDQGKTQSKQFCGSTHPLITPRHYNSADPRGS